MDLLYDDLKNFQSKEMPFDYNWNARATFEWAALLGLPPSPSSAHAEMRSALLINLWLAGPGGRVFYARGNNVYARHARWAPRWYTRRNMVAVVDELVDCQLVVERRTKPSATPAKRSTLNATPLLWQRLPALRVSDLCWDLRDPILLRDHHKEFAPYHDTAKTRAMRRDVKAQNELCAALDIRLNDEAWLRDDRGFYRHHDGRILNPRRQVLYRVFNASWRRGGRFYGGWWQQLSSRARTRLTIDGAEVVEHDINACHLRMAAALAGVELPRNRDPYLLAADRARLQVPPALCRKLVKTTIMILINATGRASAVAAVRREAWQQGVTPAGPAAHQLVGAVNDAFPGLDRVWHRGIGLTLQWQDSEVAAAVQRQLRRSSIVALSVHDSFLTARQNGGALKELLEVEFQRCLRALPALRIEL